MISIEGIQRTEQAHIYMIEFSLSFYVEISTDIDFFPLFFFFFFLFPCQPDLAINLYIQFHRTWFLTIYLHGGKGPLKSIFIFILIYK